MENLKSVIPERVAKVANFVNDHREIPIAFSALSIGLNLFRLRRDISAGRVTNTVIDLGLLGLSALSLVRSVHTTESNKMEPGVVTDEMDARIRRAVAEYRAQQRIV